MKQGLWVISGGRPMWRLLKYGEEGQRSVYLLATPMIVRDNTALKVLSFVKNDNYKAFHSLTYQLKTYNYGIGPSNVMKVSPY